MYIRAAYVYSTYVYSVLLRLWPHLCESMAICLTVNVITNWSQGNWARMVSLDFILLSMCSMYVDYCRTYTKVNKV